MPRCALARAECSATPPDPAVVAANRVSACVIAPEQMRAELAGVIAAETDAFADRAAIDPAQPAAVDARTITKSFTVRRRWLDRSGPQQSKLQALRGVSLTVAHGESVALVGKAARGNRHCCGSSRVWRRRPPARSSWPETSARRWSFRTPVRR